MNNSQKYPEAWAFFVKHARNVEKEWKSGELPNKYRISVPDESGDFIYSDDPGKLFEIFVPKFYAIAPRSPSVYGRVQYIIQHL